MIIPVDTNGGKYDVYVERGCLSRAGSLLKLDRRVLVVTDTGVPREYAETVARQCKEGIIAVMNQGEGDKNLATVQKLCQEMLDNSFTRSDCVVAVGGGVVGDTAALTASLYMRGVQFYNIPTTLLSQVDSSVGGKTGVNFGGVKNILGVFNQPDRVLIDPETLRTLDDRLFNEGLAESIKMAMTCDENLFELIENGDARENIDEIIEKSLLIKRFVVEQDEREAGLRRVLNFGHTFGHGLESTTGGKYYHGECVALGMLPMTDKFCLERLKSVLKKNNLPVSCEFDFDAVENAVSHDKKGAGGKITATLALRPGEFEFKTMTAHEVCLRALEVL